MGDVIPFPELASRAAINQLKRENCSVRIDVTVDPEMAVELIYQMGLLDVDVRRESISIIRPASSSPTSP